MKVGWVLFDIVPVTSPGPVNNITSVANPRLVNNITSVANPRPVNNITSVANPRPVNNISSVASSLAIMASTRSTITSARYRQRDAKIR